MGDIDKGKQLDCLNPKPLLWLSQTRTSAGKSQSLRDYPKARLLREITPESSMVCPARTIFRQSQPRSQENGLGIQKN